MTKNQKNRLIKILKYNRYIKNSYKSAGKILVCLPRDGKFRSRS